MVVWLLSRGGGFGAPLLGVGARLNLKTARHNNNNRLMLVVASDLNVGSAEWRKPLKIESDCQPTQKPLLPKGVLGKIRNLNDDVHEAFTNLPCNHSPQHGPRVLLLQGT